MSAWGAPTGSNNPEGMQEGTIHEGVRCPKCGKRFGNLPNHLPECSGGKL